jgi:hypothetical protein
MHNCYLWSLIILSIIGVLEVEVEYNETKANEALTV